MNPDIIICKERLPEIYREALQEMHRAEEYFNNAGPEYVESACLRMAAAREHLNNILKEVKHCDRD